MFETLRAYGELKKTRRRRQIDSTNDYRHNLVYQKNSNIHKDMRQRI